MHEQRTLWICWQRPAALPPPGTPVLSFLSPAEEEELERRGCVVTSMRRALDATKRSEARRLYHQLVASIGTFRADGHPTLRQSMARLDTSDWWYHRVSFRDCESDPTFNWILAVFAIGKVACASNADTLHLVGAPDAIRRSLIGWRVTASSTQSVGRSRFQAIASRLRFALTTIRDARACRRIRSSTTFCDIALAAFWDWSVGWDSGTGKLTDRYFKRLPERLRNVAWFAWLDPNSEPGKEGRALADVLAPLDGRSDVVLLQRFLSTADIVRQCTDLQPLRTFLAVRRHRQFRALFRRDGIDLYPLFQRQLLVGFFDASIPRGRLMAMAAERAARTFTPRAAITFLEHFPESRAFYAGIRRASDSILCCTTQHASYCHEKTFLQIDPEIEMRGVPDGCSMPHPDIVFAMGNLARQLFTECGYSRDKIVVTGSPRYDGTIITASSRTTSPSRPLRLLMVSTLSLDVEIQMLEAVVAATEGIPGIELAFRNHPFRRIEDHSRYPLFQNRISIANASLRDDIGATDLVMFVYSTVAEEALLAGKPVWQWLPIGYNGSALAEVLPIPKFGSVRELRQALLSFQANPEKFQPTQHEQRTVLESLFHTPSGSSDRIAAALKEYLSADSQSLAAMTNRAASP